MKITTSLLFYIFSGLFLLSSYSFAETRYIKDEIRIEMHSGPTTGYRIIRYLKSGDTLKILQLSDDKKWYQIETRGKTGWVKSQYTTDKPIAKALLAQSKQKQTSLAKQNQTLTTQLAEARGKLKATKTLLSSIESSSGKLSQRLKSIEKAASNAINTERSYQLLQEKAEMLNVTLEKLEEENKILGADNIEDGIIWGVFAVFAGVILTLLIPKMSTQKRRSEW